MKVQYITVKDLYDANAERVRLSILNDESSFERKIFEKELHRPGLALSGFVEVFTYWRVQIMGNTEIGYLNTLHGKERIRAIASVLGFDLPCLIITNDNVPPDELLEIADENGITVFSTPLTTTTVTHHLSEFLDGIFADTTIVHGSMLEVFGVGVLITGESAIGKSELALDLIERGHQLVADDVVHVTKVGASQLEGAPSHLLAHHMEIRGLGIIDIRKLFGIRAVRGKKGVEVIVHLEKWDNEKEYERIGMEETAREILDVPIPLITLPIVPGKNITIIAEAVALNQKLKEQGTYTARDFNDRLIAKMNKSESD